MTMNPKPIWPVRVDVLRFMKERTIEVTEIHANAKTTSVTAAAPKNAGSGNQVALATVALTVRSVISLALEVEIKLL